MNPFLLLVRVMALALLLAAAGPAVRPAGAQANPDFDAVAWTPMGCDASPLTQSITPAEVNLVGDAIFPAAYTARDATYLYFRFRLDGSPAGTRGFTRSAWTVLVQVPSGDPFQYQYQLSLSGEGPGGDPIEIWANAPAQDIDFANIEQDDSETRLFTQIHDHAGPDTVNTTPLARTLATGDGSSFKNSPDYFLDFAFPIAALLSSGVVTSPAELDTALFFPATATSSNRHNKDHLNCRFLPRTVLAVEASVTPSVLEANVVAQLGYTITVQNTGSFEARGVAVPFPDLPPYRTGATVPISFSSDDPSVTSVAPGPGELVRVPRLPPGASFTVGLVVEVLPGCGAGTFVTTARAAAVNAPAASDTGSVTVDDSTAPEVCDGLDNDCDGRTDEDTAVQCSDGNPCNGAEICGGQAGCQPGPPLDCGDGDPCTTDTCDFQLGCVGVPIAGCIRCATAADCSDGEPCTTDTCAGGVCVSTPIPGCDPCTTPADCNDSNPCTADACPAGICTHTLVIGCVRCTIPADCDDRDACTADTCTGGVCGHDPIAPTPEVCDGDVDDDCDGATDCDDPDCADTPACAPPESCGNCQDDDLDGRIDYEDPDCCTVPRTLAVERLTLRPTTVRVRGDRLRLTAVYAPTAPALFDPLKQDTTIQLSDASGSLLCTTIPAARWRRGHGLAIQFADRRGEFADGLESGRFVVNRKGQLTFQTRGRGVAVRSPTDGTVRITVRVGRECSQSTAALRPKKKGLVYP